MSEAKSRGSYILPAIVLVLVVVLIPVLRGAGLKRTAERSLVYGGEDLARILEGLAPRHALNGPTLLKDGGSEIWEGRCYSVTRLHRLHVDEQGRRGILEGAELSFGCVERLAKTGVLREDRSETHFVADVSAPKLRVLPAEPDQSGGAKRRGQGEQPVD